MTDRPVTVLAVDDQPANLRLLDAVLTPRGYRVVPAASGQEALDLLEDLDVDLVLLDVVMPGLDGHEVCRRIRARRTNGVPAGRDDHGQRRPAAARRPGVRGRRLHHQAVRPGRAARAGRLPGPAQALPRHDRARRPPSWRPWNTELERRVAAGVAELERTNRLRHFLSPQLAEVVVGDQALLGSHRREIVVVFFDFHGFTDVRRDQRARRGDGGAARLPRRRGHARARAREAPSSASPATGSWSSSTTRSPATTRPSGRCGCPSTSVARSRRLAEGWRRHGHDLTHRTGIAHGLRHAGPDRLPRPLRLRRHRQRHQPRVPAVQRRRATGRCASPTGCWPRSSDRAEAELVGDVQPRGLLATPSASTTSASLDAQAGDAMTTYTVSRGLRAAHPLRPRRRRALRRLRPLQERMPHVWDGMRRDLGDESVVVVPSISLDAPPRPAAPSPRRWRSGRCSCCSCCDSRGCG